MHKCLCSHFSHFPRIANWSKIVRFTSHASQSIATEINSIRKASILPQLQSFPHTKDRKFVLKLKEHDSPLYPQHPSRYPPWIRTSAAASASQSRGFVGLRPLLSDSDHFCRTPTTFVGLRRICRSPTKFVGLFTQWIQLNYWPKASFPQTQ